MKINDLSKKGLGDYGEELAASYLKEAGLEVVARNYRCPKGEMDIIAREGEWYIFIEVRSKTSGKLGYAEESINKRKGQRLRDIASYYFLEKGFKDWPLLRIDLLAILFTEGSPPEINWIKNAL